MICSRFIMGAKEDILAIIHQLAPDKIFFKTEPVNKRKPLSLVTTAICLASLAAILVAFAPVPSYGMPPHPDLAEAMKAGTKPTPDFISNPDILRAKGINQPSVMPQPMYEILSGSPPLRQGPSGTFNALAICVEFSDNASTVSATDFNTLIFDSSGATVRNYYDEVSYGTLDIVTVNLPSALGWRTASQTYSYYVNNSYGLGTYPQNSQKLCEEMVDAVDSVVDFSNYDNDGDNYVDALFIIHAGPGAEYTGNNTDIWSHAWSIVPRLRDGVYISEYSMEPEYWVSAGDMTCGVYCHELGHLFGLPDLYDRDYSSDGIGEWSLMASGSWNGTNGDTPAHPDAWCRLQLDFASATVVPDEVIGLNIEAVENASDIYYLWYNGQSNIEYFLIENRQAIGYDSALPGNGLCIWHVDETYIGYYDQNDDECYYTYDNCDCDGHYLVSLEQADGLMDLEWGSYFGGNSGDAGDPYPGSSVNREFTALSIPNSGSYFDCSSAVAVTNISNSATIMTADISVASIVSPPGQVIALDQISLNASCPQGQDAPSQTFDIWNSGSGTMEYILAVYYADWLLCDPSSGNSTGTGDVDTVTVNFNTSHLSPGSYSGTIAIFAPSASNNPQIVRVTLLVGGNPLQTGGGGGGGDEWYECFIATAAYGSPMEEEVIVLKQFRDSYLLSNWPGRAFVKLYYQTSPPLANFIGNHEKLRLTSRIALTPVIWFCAFTLKSPNAAGVIVLSVTCCFFGLFLNALYSRRKMARSK